MTWEILQGDCIEVMAKMEEASVDAVVCDPPYGLSREPDIAEVLSHWLAGDDYQHRGGGFMGQSWDSFVPGPAYWRAATRVLRPGGHLLAFAGTRTIDLMGIAIRMAGFEIRDSLLWLYGSGFPKSLDVSKAIDKAAGAEREVVGPPTRHGGGTNSVYAQDDWTRENQATMGARTEPATPEAAQWDGWGTALKPAHEPIIIARKPLIRTVSQNVLEHGTGGINVDGCRVGSESTERPNGANALGVMNDDGWEPSEGIGGSKAGRWPANVVLSHLEECEEMGVKKVKGQNPVMRNDQQADGGYQGISKRKAGQALGHADPDGTEIVEAWSCAPGCPVAELDAQSGVLQSGSRAEGVRQGIGYMGGVDGNGGPAIIGDSGGASRFFYCAKTSRAERDAGLEGFPDVEGGFRSNTSGQHLTRRDGGDPGPAKNGHSTVKPINIMRWLVRLVTPPGGVVLDMFGGSGTTGCAAVLEGFDVILIEREPEYVEICKGRIAFWAQHEGREVKEVLKISARSRKAAKVYEDGRQLALAIGRGGSPDDH